jgi:hypothetical protein
VALLFWLRVSYSTYSIGEERQTGLPYFHLLKTLPNLVMTLHASLSIVLSCNRKLFFNIFCAKKKKTFLILIPLLHVHFSPSVHVSNVQA